MGGLKTRELESYKPGLTTSTDSDSHLLTETGRSCGLEVKAPASKAGGPVFESLKRFGLEARYDGSPEKGRNIGFLQINVREVAYPFKGAPVV